MRAILLDYTREKSSRNGNPRYTVLLVTEDGTPYQATTAPDSGYAANIPALRGRWVAVDISVKRHRPVLEAVTAAPNQGPVTINPRG